MVSLHEQYVTDGDGKRVAVILPIEEFEALLEDFEDRYAGARYREASADRGGSLPLEEALAKIEEERAGR